MDVSKGKGIKIKGVAAVKAAGKGEEKKMEKMEIAYVNYDRRVQVDMEMFIISMWNKYAEYEGRNNRIYLNNNDFFEKSFKNPYDAAWAVSTGTWKWTDEFVCFNDEGHLSSFSHWDDENSPIDLDKIDVSHLVDRLNSLKTNKKGYVDNNISKAIHEAFM